MDKYTKEFADRQEARHEEWKQKNNSSEFKEGYERVFKDAIALQFMINHKIKIFNKENNCNLMIDVVDGEIKVGVFIDIDKKEKL
jgi:hypothetical protein